MMHNGISLVHTSDTEEGIKNSIFEALKLLNFTISSNVRTVDIKPNLNYYWDATTGQTTDPRVVGAIIDWIRSQQDTDPAIRIVEADATAMSTKYAFSILGYRKLAQEKKVELFNLSKDEVKKEKVKVGQRTLTFTVPTSLLKADLFINVPKLKVTTAEDVYITCALKNLFGCIAPRRKIRYHKFLNEAIVGINKIIHPNVTVVDGVIALGRYPVKLGLIMAGDNPFSIDWISSQIMGYNPAKIEFLKLAQTEGLGNPKEIVTLGENLEEFKKIFPRKDMRTSKLVMNMQIKMLKLYTKLAGDITHPILEGM